ncbi:MAG: polysaccharide biosynthesis/export family protein [Puniceicoccaceae bacterium]
MKPRPGRFFLLSLLCLFAGGLSASAQSSEDGDAGEASDTRVPRSDDRADNRETMVAPANYRIKPSDVLFVEIFQQRDLQKEARVEADGTITLHLIGRVNVEGLTVSEAREKITEFYDRDYLVNPQIDLQVIHFNTEQVQVLGQVRTPGSVAIPPDDELTLLQAISRSGGFTRLARKGAVQIRRESEDGETKVFIINATDLISDPDSEGFILEDGDIVFVDERIL